MLIYDKFANSTPTKQKPNNFKITKAKINPRQRGRFPIRRDVARYKKRSS